jgi:hypothetical protein
MALPPRPGGLPQRVPPATHTATFMQYYNDTSRDEHNCTYVMLMTIFDSPGGPQTPAQLRDLVSNNPRESSLGFVVLCLPAHNPAHTGMIYTINSLTKVATCLGHPATQWDGHIFGSINGVAGNQIPTTVEFPADAFSQQGGGAYYQVVLPPTNVRHV